MEDHIDPNTDITTNKRTGHQPLKKTFMNLDQIYPADKGGDFPGIAPCGNEPQIMAKRSTSSC